MPGDRIARRAYGSPILVEDGLGTRPGHPETVFRRQAVDSIRASFLKNRLATTLYPRLLRWMFAFTLSSRGHM
jgi:hypothetical protein